jgi:endonuclease/exonuclease/phosphatase (EEP) superfamily protein YafD
VSLSDRDLDADHDTDHDTGHDLDRTVVPADRSPSPAVQVFGPPRARRGRLAAFMIAVEVALVLTAVGFVVLEVLRRAGWNESVKLVFLYGIMPFVALGALACLVFSLVLRRWFAVAAFVPVLVLHLAAIVPAMGDDDRPAWADDAPTFTVFFGNLHANGPDVDSKYQAAVDAGAEVMVLVEITPDGFADIVRLAGPDRYPHVLDASAWGTGGFAIFSELPLALPLGDPKPTSTLIAAEVTIGTTDVQVFGEHTTTPTSPEGLERWIHQFNRLRETLDRVEAPVLLVGDFNATRWHEQMEDLRADYDFESIHEALGEGLSRSFPTEGRRLAKFGPLLRIDHGLFDDGLFPLSVRDVRMVGSDHLGFVTEIAVRQDP